MKDVNKQKDRIQTTCTPQELGRAISAIDLSSIPPENRKAAITERMMEVMLATTEDVDERRKEHFQQAASTYGQIRRRRARSSIII